MLVSYSHNFLFTHSLRTGGTSFKSVLRPLSSNPERYIENRVLRALGIRINHYTLYQRKWFRGHTSALTAKRNIPADVWDGLFKFTNARNPFDRLVSLYHHLQNHKTGVRLKDMGFDAFVREWSLDPKLQQKELIIDENGELLMDYIGHFETLAQDFQYITSRIGLDATLPHKNGSVHKDYREYYTPELIKLVNERFAEDLEFFGYEFDTAAPKQRLTAAA